MKTISGLCLFLLGFATGAAVLDPVRDSSRAELLADDLAFTRQELASTRIALDRLRREKIDQGPGNELLPPQQLPID